MRSWIPWTSLVLLAAVAVVAGVIGATSSSHPPTHRDLISPFYTPAGSLIATPHREPTTLAPQSGYQGVENFCAVAPLTGTIHYDGTGGASGDLSHAMTVMVGGLPPNSYVYVNWSNDHIRAPIIAGFSTDSTAAVIQSSVEVSRLGEVRGVEIVLSGGSPDVMPPPLLGRLEPC
jgi:hypothetical protein